MGEFSFVVLGADENTSAQIAATQQETEMDTPTYLADNHPAAPSGEAEVAAIRAAAAAEVKRIAAIR